MRILILAGTGGTGRALVGQALGRGHEVTVLARTDLAAVMLDLAETGAHARARVWVAY